MNYLTEANYVKQMWMKRISISQQGRKKPKRYGSNLKEQFIHYEGYLSQSNINAVKSLIMPKNSVSRFSQQPLQERPMTN